MERRVWVVYFILWISTASCHVKGQKQPAQFDIQTFERHQVAGAWTYTDTHGNKVSVRKDEGEYWEEITGKDSFFTQRHNYYLNGRIKLDAQYYHDSGFAKGTWTYYDKQGEIIKIEDKDAPFKKFPWEKVLAYLNRSHVSVWDKFTTIHNEYNSRGAFWIISWNTRKPNDQGYHVIKNARIDCNTGGITFQKDTYCCRE